MASTCSSLARGGAVAAPQRPACRRRPAVRTRAPRACPGITRMIRKRRTASAIRRVCESGSSSEVGASELQQVVLALALMARSRMPAAAECQSSSRTTEPPASVIWVSSVGDDLGAPLILGLVGEDQRPGRICVLLLASDRSPHADGLSEPRRRPTIAAGKITPWQTARADRAAPCQASSPVDARAEILRCDTDADWQRWLEEHHDGSAGVWLMFAKKGC